MGSPRGTFMAVALLALLGMACSFEAPLLMWSGANVFNGKSVQITSTVPASQFASILNKVASLEAGNLNQNIASAFSAEATQSEVVVLYLEPQLRTDQVSNNRDSMLKLKEQVASARSSVVVPFVAIETWESNVVPNTVVSLAQSIAANANVYYFSTGAQRTRLLNALKKDVPALNVLVASDISNDHEMFSNNKIDLFIVELSNFETTTDAKLAGDAATVETIQSVVQQSTSGRFVSLFTSLAISEPTIQYEFSSSIEHVQIAGFERNVANSTNGTDGNPPDWAAYFPYWFWEGLIYIILFIAIALFAVGLLGSIQTPTVFLSEKKKNE